MSTVVKVSLSARQVCVLNAWADREGLSKQQGRASKALNLIVDDALDAVGFDPDIRDALRKRYGLGATPAGGACGPPT